MVHDLGKLNQNNMENRQGSTSKFVAFDSVKDTELLTGDVLVLGALPRESITTDIRVLTHEAFDGTPAYELGYYDYASGTFVSFAAVTAPAPVNQTTIIAMPVVGQVDEAGAPYAGDRGGIWNGEKETVVAMKWLGATPPTVGAMEAVFSHSYFGTKQGAYGMDRVPMSVYEKGHHA